MICKELKIGWDVGEIMCTSFWEGCIFLEERKINGYNRVWYYDIKSMCIFINKYEKYFKFDIKGNL